MSKYDPFSNPVARLYRDFLEDRLDQNIEELPRIYIRTDKALVTVSNPELYHSIAQAMNIEELEVIDLYSLLFGRHIAQEEEGFIVAEDHFTRSKRMGLFNPRGEEFLRKYGHLYNIKTSVNIKREVEKREVARLVEISRKEFNKPSRRLGRWLSDLVSRK